MKNILTLFKLLLILLTVSLNYVPSADASDKSWRDDLVPKEVQGICDRTESINLPQQDFPKEEEKENLKDCSSKNLYYGISIAQDYTSARKCAILELKPDDNGFVDGAAILMMIYANGYGVDKNIEVAKKMACNMWSAPYELALRIQHLSNDLSKPIDICDDITSGVMMGSCASIHYDIEEDKKLKKLRAIMNKWPENHKKEFLELDESAKKYAQSLADTEVDMAGSARGAFYFFAKNTITDEFKNFIYDLEENKQSPYTNIDFFKADKLLNTEYQTAVKRKFDEISQISKEGIKKTQLLWIKYRDNWVKFSAVHYPNVSAYTIKTRLTLERIESIKRIGDNSSFWQ